MPRVTASTPINTASVLCRRVGRNGHCSHLTARASVRLCANALVGRIDAIDAEVLATLQDDILRPSIIKRAVALVHEALAPERESDRRARALLQGPLRFTPVLDDCRRVYVFEGAIALDRIIAGEAMFQHLVRPQRDSSDVAALHFSGFSDLRAA
jgi:hypothetical protein